MYHVIYKIMWIKKSEQGTIPNDMRVDSRWGIKYPCKCDRLSAFNEDFIHISPIADGNAFAG